MATTTVHYPAMQSSGSEPRTVIGMGATTADRPLERMEIERRALRANDVRIAIEHCGVCHSDLHQVRDEWRDTQPTQFPCVPGHEIVGRVLEVGADVTRFAVDDLVGVGCMVDSCRECEQCRAGQEQFCEQQPTLTYNGEDRITGDITKGGYSQEIVVRHEFVLRIPDGMDPAVAAPILCAGITTYSPLKHWRVGAGTKVAVVGIGGLGHMGVQIASAFGADVTAITTSSSKGVEAKELGADAVLDSTDDAAMERAAKSFDLILSTIPDAYDPNPYIGLLAKDGTLVNVGALVKLDPAPDMFGLVSVRGSLAGSMIGGIAETQEVLDFCAEHHIEPRIEHIALDEINDAFDRMQEGDVHYRFVIDMASASDSAS